MTTDPETPTSRLPPLLAAVRPGQWPKNLLVLVPLVTSHRLTDGPSLARGGVAVAAFCLAASAVYLVNDCADVEADRAHPRKRHRPIAAGRLSVGVAMAVAVGLLVASAIVAIAVGRPFAVTLGLYVALAMAYSLFLKRRLLADAIALASLYTLRIVAGAAAIAVPLTPWLLAFAMFLFLSLAFLKRYAELARVEGEGGTAAGRRGYLTVDLPVIAGVGSACGVMAVLVLALYIHDAPTARQLYREPALLWLACPVLLYWVTRTWFLAGRRSIVDDPLAFAMADKVSWACGAIVAAIVVAARYSPGVVTVFDVGR